MRAGKAFVPHERRTVIGDGDVEAEADRESDHGVGVASGAEDEQLRRREEDFDERLDRFSRRRRCHETVSAAGERSGGRTTELRGERLVRDVGAARASRQRPAACAETLGPLRAKDGRERERLAPGKTARGEREMTPIRTLGNALDQHLDRSLAPRSEAEDEVFVRPCVVRDEGRVAALDDGARTLGEVGLETASGDETDAAAALFDQHARPGAAIRRSDDTHHRHERGPFSTRADLPGCGNHLAKIAQPYDTALARPRPALCLAGRSPSTTTIVTSGRSPRTDDTRSTATRGRSRRAARAAARRLSGLRSCRRAQLAPGGVVTFVHRGVVEGFYGPPWSHDDRLWMVERMGRWGMNRYVHAPKNDPLHRDRWREPYPEPRMREFAALVEHGAKHGVEVAFAISPGLSIRYASNDDAALLAEKLRSFVRLGARSLALFLDDVPSHLVHEEDRRRFASLADAHVALAAALLEALGPAVSWWLCPMDYLGVGSSEYLETLGAGLPGEIEVGWTGRTVCSPAIARAEAQARVAALRRRLLIWDNVPVSDGPMRFMLHLGPYGRRDSDLSEVASGVLLNPMQHAHASAIAIRTAAEYLRDPARYDPERAWREALEEVGEGAPDALALFAAAHRFSAIWPDDRDRALEDGLAALRGGLARGDVDPAIRSLQTLCDERLACANSLREGLTDRALLAEIEPWIASHRIETQRIRWAVDAVTALAGSAGAAAKVAALFGLEVRLGIEAEPRQVSYGPRRVLYPQLASMAEEAMALGRDPALVRGRCLADEFVALAEDLALERLAPRPANA